MARRQRLKVYRTPIGFHDAYVAAPSRKAALLAWGADADLFARGVAETVDDEALIREPLRTPGAIVRVPRGTSAEHMAALPPDAPARPEPAPADDDAPRPEAEAGGKPRAKPRAKPRPSRASLDKAEGATERAKAGHDDAIARLHEAEAALRQQRRDLERRHDAEIARLEAALARSRARYAAALERWRGRAA